jgi:hypothetical protein
MEMVSTAGTQSALLLSVLTDVMSSDSPVARLQPFFETFVTLYYSNYEPQLTLESLAYYC